MVKCNNEGCLHKKCCIECENKNNNCMCEIAQELNYDKKLILQKCEYAEITQYQQSAKESKY